MNSKHIALYSAVGVLAIGIGTGYYAWSAHKTLAASPIVQATKTNGKLTPVSDYVAHPLPGTPTKSFTLTAESKTITLKPGTTVQAMTFNGTAPGPLLTVHQGDLVEVTVHNRLSVPITIHWHGIAVPGTEDGVPGLTQAPIQPGATYVYRFIAKNAGTYWYHSHINSVQEIGKGLFGAIVVLPKDQTTSAPDKDYTLLLHEWSTSSMSSGDQDMGNMDSMSGMSMGDMGSMHMGSPGLRTNGFQVTDMDKSALVFANLKVDQVSVP